MQLSIIYEDKDILVCVKPAGIATQTAKISEPDMVSWIKNYLAKQSREKSTYVGVIHRLDLPVSGLLVFAKTKRAAADLSRQIQTEDAGKEYLALCMGCPREKKGTLIHYIRQDALSRKACVMPETEFIFGQTEPEYKKAILTYEVKEDAVDAALLKVHLQTGRFHQIRAQFAAIGHPLLGDVKYGTPESRRLSLQRKVDKIALCADGLIFCHPVTGKKMEFTLEEKYLPVWAVSDHI